MYKPDSYQGHHEVTMALHFWKTEVKLAVNKVIKSFPYFMIALHKSINNRLELAIQG